MIVGSRQWIVGTTYRSNKPKNCPSKIGGMHLLHMPYSDLRQGGYTASDVCLSFRYSSKIEHVASPLMCSHRRFYCSLCLFHCSCAGSFKLKPNAQRKTQINSTQLNWQFSLVELCLAASKQRDTSGGILQRKLFQC